ncbi:MAG: class I SAM-dependent methyltransferase [Actinomycetota bacterium]
MEDEWAPYADDWDEDEAANAYAAAAFGSLQSILADAEVGLRGSHVLDFGAGTGLLTERLVDAGATVVAIDTSAAMLSVLRAKVAERGLTGVTTDTDLAVAPTGLDLVVCSSVCSFLDDYPAMAARLASLLRPGGVFVQWDWERVGEEDEHGLTRSEIAEALTGAGLEGVTVATAFSVQVGEETMQPLVGHGRAGGPAGD